MIPEEERRKAWRANFASLPDVGVPPMPENWYPPEVREEMPSAVQQAWNLTKACGRHAANGMKRTTDEQFRERIKICETCPFLVKESNRCGACGCWVSPKAKMASEVCPQGKWPEI